jgi:hypothetical protein
MTTVSHLGNSPGAQCGYRPRDKAGQNAKLSPNVPPWRSADCGLADWIDLGTHSILALIGTDVRLHHWSRNLPLARYDAK